MVVVERHCYFALNEPPIFITQGARLCVHVVWSHESAHSLRNVVARNRSPAVDCPRTKQQGDRFRIGDRRRRRQSARDEHFWQAGCDGPHAGDHHRHEAADTAVGIAARSAATCLFSEATLLPVAVSEKLRFDQMIADRVTNEIGGAMDRQLGEDIFAVGFDRAEAEFQSESGVLVALALGQQPND